MKKRILSLFLAVIMVVSILPVTAFAAEPDFTGWTVLTTDGGSLSDGEYYLNADVTLTSNLVIEGNDVVLDLNGHVLKGNGSGCVINITSSGDVVKKLTLKDSAPATVHTGDFASLPAGGIITGGKEAYGGGVCVSNGKASFVMEGGTITGNEATYNGGGVSVGNLNATFTMLGGTISGNTANGNGGGVSVLNGNAKFTMNDGAIIKNNRAKNGAGVYVFNENASLVMNGGSISENTVSSDGGGGGGVFVNASATASVMNGGSINDNDGGTWGGGVNVNAGCMFIMTGGSISGNKSQYGGGMFVGNNGASFTMTGGSISGNACSTNTGGGVYLGGGGVVTFTLGGTAKITGNVGGATLSGGTVSGGTNNNLYICEGKSVTLGEGVGDATNGVAVPVTGESGMSVGVTYGSAKGIGTFTSNTATDEEMKCFIPDEAGKYIVRNSESKLEFVTPWSALQAALSAETLTISNSIPNIFDVTIDNAVPNIKLLKDITADTGDTTLNVTATKILDLNGKIIDGKISDSSYVGSVITIGSGAALTLKDSAPTASHTGNYASLPAGGIITGGSAESGGGVSNSGTFVMTGGTITGNRATQNGGGVYTTGDSICVLTGGTITGNTATVSGGGLYLQEEMCFVAGTPITMADGTRKPIETLEIGDLVRVFDHDTGRISTAKLFDVGKYPEKHSGVLTLHFSHDIDLTVVYGHSFFEREANKYVTVSRDNVESFVGHEFYNVDDACWETLTGYELVDGAVDTYIITSEKHLNSVANGMLNNEDGFYTMITNIFEFGDGLKTDAEKKAKDIEKYGLWSFDNAKYISRNTYDVLNLQYLNVAFGKGMITPERFDYLEAFWTAIYPEGFCDPEEPEENELGIRLMLLGEEPSTSTLPTDAGLYVGGTLKITGNSSGNLYLPSSKQITIGTGTSTGGNGVAVPATGFMVGVSTASAPTAATPVAITENGTATDVAYFTSDNSDYQVVYSPDNGCLKLCLPSYTVTFNMNGHGTQVPSQTVVTGDIAECPEDPSESGWTFAGWYGDAGLATPYAFTAAVNANTTIYAKWTSNAPAPDPDPDYLPIIIVTPEPTIDPEPTKEVTEEYTVPVESDKDSVQVSTKIEDGIAKVDEITGDVLKKLTEKETSGEEADITGDTTDSVSIDLSGTKQNVTGVELTKKSVENLANVVSDENNIDSAVINMKEASVELDAKTLETIHESMAGETVKLVVDKLEVNNLNENQKKAHSKYDVSRIFEVYWESNGEVIHDFKGGTAKVSVRFTPEKDKKGENYSVYYLDENGSLRKHTTKYENGMLTFLTGHFSDFAVIYDNVKNVLLAEASTTKKGYIKLSWNEIDGAVKYVVYGAKCGKSYKELTKTDGSSFTVKKINDAKPVSGKTYKFYVVAYDALGNEIKSKSIHYIVGDAATKYANVATISVSRTALELTVGEKVTVGAEYTMYGDKKHLSKKHGKALRFTSDCTEVAKVSNDGTVTAKSEGKAVIYIQDISGKWCTVEVTVKEK